jgi:DNA-binding ferritin-like protein
MILVKFAESVLSPLVAAINELTQTVKTTGENIVSAYTDLQGAVADFGARLSTNLGDLNTSISAEISAVTAALQNPSGGTSDEQIQAVTDSLTTLRANVDAGFAAAKQAIDDETAKLTAPPTA